jgi:preprotein translocase subunit SecY
MKRFFQTIRNIFSIEDLRVRILNTIGFLMIFRLGSYVVLPGVDPDKLTTPGGIFDFLDIFLGGAFNRASIFALGIMPYISASIVIQLLTVAVPYFQKMQKEGDSGRKKMTQITRVLTIAITAAQSISYIAVTIPAEAILVDSRLFFTVSSVIIITTGTMFCMWLGERITDKGIGNGISMLIMIGIIAGFPQALIQEAAAKGMQGALLFVLEILALFFVVMAVVMLTQAIRRIPVQYAKQVVGNKVYGGQRQYIPLKVNSSGVMPIIFAQALMFIPGMVAGFWRDSSEIANVIGNTFNDFTSWQYNVVFGILVVVFTFFYTAITVNPNDIADNFSASASTACRGLFRSQYRAHHGRRKENDPCAT